MVDEQSPLTHWGMLDSHLQSDIFFLKKICDGKDSSPGERLFRVNTSQDWLSCSFDRYRSHEWLFGEY